VQRKSPNPDAALLNRDKSPVSKVVPARLQDAQDEFPEGGSAQSFNPDSDYRRLLGAGLSHQAMEVGVEGHHDAAFGTCSLQDQCIIRGRQADLAGVDGIDARLA
jgi:hypothetical protein